MSSVKKLLFIQPIVSHYRESVVKEITNLEPNSEFWGTSDYLGVEPLKNIDNVDNSFKTVKILGSRFIWYKGLIFRFLKNKSTHVIISGINPLLVQTFIIFIIGKLFTKKKMYWWSQGKKFKQGYLGKKLRYFFYQLSDGVFLYSQQGKTNFEEEGISTNKLFVINNSLNFQDYGYLQYSLQTLQKTDFRVLYTGRLSKRKKIFVVLEAFKHLKEKGVNDIYLDIIGDGEEKLSLLSYIKENGLSENIKLYGSIYGLDIHAYFLNASIVVCPGAVGLSIAHALSFGLPFITGKNDPNHSSELELLLPGENGDYFLLNDSEDLANKIIEWKDKLKQDKNKYINSCIHSIVNFEYLPDKVAQKLVQSLT